jgi:hypothetical protein
MRLRCRSKAIVVAIVWLTHRGGRCCGLRRVDSAHRNQFQVVQEVVTAVCVSAARNLTGQLAQLGEARGFAHVVRAAIAKDSIVNDGTRRSLLNTPLRLAVRLRRLRIGLDTRVVGRQSRVVSMDN